VCLFPDQKLHRDIYVEMNVTDRVQEAYNALGYLDVPKGSTALYMYILRQNKFLMLFRMV